MKFMPRDQGCISNFIGMTAQSHSNAGVVKNGVAVILGIYEAV